ncbi:hypothetical protein HGA88_01420 [Candidatus Roizmanbacteria bacterium]|nr:hypothetical protein [Candidatus Roizmanbacteria bacterium]
MTEPVPPPQEQLNLPVIPRYTVEMFGDNPQSSELIDLFSKHVDLSLEQIEASPYATRINREKIQEYRKNIAAGSLPSKWQLVNRLNEIVYVESLLSNPDFAEADAKFEKYRKEVLKPYEEENLTLRAIAEAEFDKTVPSITINLQREKQIEIQTDVNRAVEKAVKDEQEKRMQGVPRVKDPKVIESNLWFKVDQVPLRSFEPVFENTLLPKIQEAASSSDTSAALLWHVIQRTKMFYNSDFFAKRYDFNNIKQDLNLQVRYSIDGITLANGKRISSLNEIDFATLQRLCDKLHEEYIQHERLVYPDEASKQAKFDEFKKNYEERLKELQLTEEEIQQIRKTAEEEAIRRWGDPNNAEPLKKEAIERMIEQLRKKALARSVKPMPQQIDTWVHSTWDQFNPKTVTFKNPTPISPMMTYRGFGGNIDLDEFSGDIILDFENLPNYFTHPPELIETDAKGETYRISERNAMGEETYLIQIQHDHSTLPQLNFICLDALGNQKNVTSVPFGEPLHFMTMVRKPVVYVYSPIKQEVNIHLNYAGEIITEYPRRKSGNWQGNALPNGTIEIDGKQYPYLFWEGTTPSKTLWDFSTGYCIAGDEAEHFLENILEKFAFNSREKTDFITYWLPELQKNEFSVISFPLAQYSALSTLTITPQPMQIIRVFMAFKKVLKPMQLEAPLISPTKRQTDVFHVVEWGGVNADRES